MKLNQILTIAVMVALSGCATITGVGKDNTPSPSALVSFKSSVAPKEIWSAKVGQQITVNGNTIFAANKNGVVTAMNLQNGKTFWKTDLNTALVGGIDAGQGVVVVASKKTEVYALNQNTGKLLWHVALSNQMITSPMIMNNNVVVKTLDGQLYALNTANGNITWRYNHGAPLMMLAKSARPETVGGKVIAGYADGKLEAYRATDGKLIWANQVAQPQGASEVEQMTDVAADPQILGDSVYAVTYQGNLVSINAATGQNRWQQPLSSYTGLALSNNTVYVTDASSLLFAFDQATGRRLFEQDNLKYRGLTSPAVMNNWVIVGDEKGYVHWLNPQDGATVGRVEVDSNDAITSLVVENNVLFVATQDGVVKRYQV